MKLPVLWIVSALAAGILLAGPGPAMPSMRPMVWLALAVAALSIPLNHVSVLLGAGRLDTSEALRYRGRLREDPIQIPGGLRCDVDLEEAEVGGEPIGVSGGLRLNYFHSETAGTEQEPELLPILRAGDRV